MLKENDNVFCLYKQYKELIYKDAEKKDARVYGTDQLAAQLTVAHMLDHMICLNIFKEDKPPTVRKVNKTWKKKFGDSAETEITQNNFQVTSTSADVKIDWGRHNNPLLYFT